MKSVTHCRGCCYRKRRHGPPSHHAGASISPKIKKIAILSLTFDTETMDTIYVQVHITHSRHDSLLHNREKGPFVYYSVIHLYFFTFRFTTTGIKQKKKSSLVYLITESPVGRSFSSLSQIILAWPFINHHIESNICTQFA